MYVAISEFSTGARCRYRARLAGFPVVLTVARVTERCRGRAAGACERDCPGQDICRPRRHGIRVGRAVPVLLGPWRAGARFCAHPSARCFGSAGHGNIRDSVAQGETSCALRRTRLYTAPARRSTAQRSAVRQPVESGQSAGPIGLESVPELYRLPGLVGQRPTRVYRGQRHRSDQSGPGRARDGRPGRTRARHPCRRDYRRRGQRFVRHRRSGLQRSPRVLPGLR